MRKPVFFAYVKIKAQISCVVTAQLINFFVFAHPLPKPLANFCGCIAHFVLDLVRNPEDRFSHDMAHSRDAPVLSAYLACGQT